MWVSVQPSWGVAASAVEQLDAYRYKLSWTECQGYVLQWQKQSVPQSHSAQTVAESLDLYAKSGQSLVKNRFAMPVSGTQSPGALCAWTPSVLHCLYQWDVPIWKGLSVSNSDAYIDILLKEKWQIWSLQKDGLFSILHFCANPKCWQGALRSVIEILFLLPHLFGKEWVCLSNIPNYL